MDYCEQEMAEGRIQLQIGLQFEDEPDSLYVAELEIDDEGIVTVWKLFFNGFDCNYTFRLAEREALILYAAEQGVKIQEHNKA